jgi:hypothetical protein
MGGVLRGSNLSNKMKDFAALQEPEWPCDVTRIGNHPTKLRDDLPESVMLRCLPKSPQAPGMLRPVRGARPYGRVGNPRTPVESPRGCSSQMGLAQQQVPRWARRPSRGAWRLTSL